MHDTTPTRFLVLDFSVLAIEKVRPVLAAIRRHDRDLADQIRRAMSSVSLNLAEGNGCDAGHRRLRYSTACGSNAEVRAALRVAVAWGYVTHAEVAPIDAILDSIGAMTYRLAHR